MTPAVPAEIGLVACSRTKLNHAAPARELYCSPLFRAASAYAQRRYGQGCWLILSARYGLVDPDSVIEPYDMTLGQLTPAERDVWGKCVAETLTGRFRSISTIWLHAGCLYRRAVVSHLPNTVRSPLAGLRIGQQLAWYRDALARLDSSGTMPSAASTVRAR